MWALGGAAPLASSCVAATPGQEASASEAIRNRQEAARRNDWMLRAGILGFLRGILVFTTPPQFRQQRTVTTARP
jgi:hypothetical protein